MRLLVIVGALVWIGWQPAGAESSVSFDRAWDTAVEEYEKRIKAHGVVGSSLPERRSAALFAANTRVEGIARADELTIATRSHLFETVFHLAGR